MEKRHQEIISNLCEMLSCEQSEIENEVSMLLLATRWIENEMGWVCEDNEVMENALKESYKEFMGRFMVYDEEGV